MVKKILISVTIKPIIEDASQFEKLLRTGVDIIRIPFWEPGISTSINDIILHIKKKFKNTKILLDLPGNKQRFGEFCVDPLEIMPERTYIITAQSQAQHKFILPVTSNELIVKSKIGDTIICGDGDAIFNVIDKNKKGLKVVSECHSFLNSRKGFAISNKNNFVKSDAEGLLTDYVVDFAKNNLINWIALSFVKNKKEIAILRNKLLKSGNSKTQIISKIETKEGLSNSSEIIKASDGIMIARGDLANYSDYGLLAIEQKNIIKECNKEKKFCILSTGVLTSLFSKAMPRAAEIADITNAIIDGVDCIQLCEETAHSFNPSYSLKILKHVVKSVTDNLKCK